MQFLRELLNAKRLNKEAILNSPCKLSVKEDGSAMQVAYNRETGELMFGKRSYTPAKLTKPMSDMDMFLHKIYYDVCAHMQKYKNIIAQYDIINFEIISPNEKHIVHYDINDIKIILLSAYKNGQLINDIEIYYLAKNLHVDKINYIELNKLSDDIRAKLLTPGITDAEIFDIFAKEYQSKLNNFNDIEGLVLELTTPDKVRLYKIQNPNFIEKLYSHLDDEKNTKSTVNHEALYRSIIDAYVSKDKSFVGQSKFERLFYMWYDIKSSVQLSADMSVISGFEISENFLKDVYPILYNLYINSTKEEKLLLIFIVVGFQNVRVKQPLWCSLDFQTMVLNPFVTDILFDNL